MGKNKSHGNLQQINAELYNSIPTTASKWERGVHTYTPIHVQYPEAAPPAPTPAAVRAPLDFSDGIDARITALG